ncbi:MAG: hypothetical protein RMA76_14265 [Deltaproteobacteria bacterium]
MLDLDQVESQFRASVKVRPKLERPDVSSVLVITDLDSDERDAFLARIRHFLKGLDDEQLVSWTVTGREDLTTVRAMLAKVEASKPDLIVAYRHLFEGDQDLPHSLGTYADMLTQATSSPVLLLPPPKHTNFQRATENSDKVLVVANAIVGDHMLVNWGLRLVEKGGELTLAHIEDDAVFKRYIDVIGKISDLDTDVAREQIEKKLLGEADGFLAETCERITEAYPDVRPSKLVRRGHTVKEYEALVKDGEYDIVVFNTKDEGQLAMHGLAYSIAVELIDRPLLML